MLEDDDLHIEVVLSQDALNLLKKALSVRWLTSVQAGPIEAFTAKVIEHAQAGKAVVEIRCRKES